VSALFFLLLALVISGVGTLVVYLRHRTPGSLESGIDSFRREMDALASSADDKDDSGEWPVRQGGRR
jgi:hypothetical protein